MPKLLAFVDVHGSATALKSIGEKIKKEKPDVLVCAGDISMFERGLGQLIARLESFGVPALIVHGNHEAAAVMAKECFFCKNIVFIHKKAVFFKGVLFVGFGGGGFSFLDREFELFVKKAEPVLGKARKIVLVTHAPPYRTAIDCVGRQHCGNKSLTSFIKAHNKNIVLSVSGHLHEGAYKEGWIGKARVINPGPYGMIIRL